MFARLRPPPASDLPASLVVALVALPLCLGIAVASGVPPISGLIAGLIGGLVVGALSPSPLMVTGPAAGLTTILLMAVSQQGSFERVLPAIILAGVLQVGLGLFKAGGFSRFVPNSVIKGMLAAIGIILILKQIPHFVGWDSDSMGDEAFWQADAENTLSELAVAFGRPHLGATFTGLASLGVLLAWSTWAKGRLRLVPAPLLAVLVGIAGVQFFPLLGESWAIGPDHRVSLPAGGLDGLFAGIPRPDWSALTAGSTWTLALTLAIVASLETLLSLEATTKIDPLRREVSGDRELLAQGIGNLAAGFLGGLPMTGVIVRSSANVDAGGTTRWSAILHAVWLLLAVLLIPGLLSQIPLSALAAVLLQVGWKLAKPSLFRAAWASGRDHFVPFLVTILAIIFTDLLIGIGIGLLAGVLGILQGSLRVSALRRVGPQGGVLQRFTLAEQVTFLHKGGILATLEGIPDGGRVELDARQTLSLDVDVLEAIHDFAASAPSRGVECRLVGFPPIPGMPLVAPALEAAASLPPAR